MLITVGGASGAFFGSMFIAAADDIADKKKVSIKDFASMWKAALIMIQKRGGAQPGDKTLVDALFAVVNTLAECEENTFIQALDQAQRAAYLGVEATKKMRAKFGRGKFLAGQTLGYQDPGATTIWLMFKSMARYFGVKEESTDSE